MSNRFVTTALYDRLQVEAHVWFCDPSQIQDAQKLSEFKAVLSAQELERYQRFHYEKDRRSYLVSHALLRHALSKYADVPASQWRFAVGEHGKPALIASLAPALCFNLAHTAGLSACVVTLNRRCGIDVESVHRENKLNAVAQRMFAVEELAQLDEKNIQSGFYYFWTLREAYVKALGTGLAGSSKDFYFDVDMDSLGVALHRDHARLENWRFRLCRPTPDHVLALGVEADEALPVLLNEWTP
jgi:4'-phosphopantetheinyl transferase